MSPHESTRAFLPLNESTEAFLLAAFCTKWICSLPFILRLNESTEAFLPLNQSMGMFSAITWIFAGPPIKLLFPGKKKIDPQIDGLFFPEITILVTPPPFPRRKKVNIPAPDPEWHFSATKWVYGLFLGQYTQRLKDRRYSWNYRRARLLFETVWNLPLADGKIEAIAFWDAQARNIFYLNGNWKNSTKPVVFLSFGQNPW